MKEKFLRHFKTKAVLTALLIVAAGIVLFGRHASPTGTEMSKPVVYYISDELHFAAIPNAIEQEHKTGKVVIDKAALRVSFPIPKPLGAGNFTGMAFIAPGVAGLSDPSTYFATPSANRRDENTVAVWNIAPLSKEEYARIQPNTKDGRPKWVSIGESFLKYPPKHMYGMQCYEKDAHFKECQGEILPGEWASMFIDDYTNLSIANWPLINVHYTTKKYGGLTVQWRAHAKHAPKWRDIDAKFWQLMHERNVLEHP